MKDVKSSETEVEIKCDTGWVVNQVRQKLNRVWHLECVYMWSVFTCGVCLDVECVYKLSPILSLVCKWQQAKKEACRWQTKQDTRRQKKHHTTHLHTHAHTHTRPRQLHTRTHTHKTLDSYSKMHAHTYKHLGHHTHTHTHPHIYTHIHVHT